MLSKTEFPYNLNTLKRDEILQQCTKLVYGYEVMVVLKHFSSLNDRDAVAQLFEFIIASENYITDIPAFIELAQNEEQIDRLFQIIIRRDIFFSFIKFSSCTDGKPTLHCFTSAKHKKAMFDLIKTTNSFQVLGGLYLRHWVEYFFSGEESLESEQKEVFWEWLIQPDNFNTMDLFELSQSAVQITKAFNSLEQLNALRQLILDLANFKDLANFVFGGYAGNNLFSGLFQSLEDKKALFNQLHNSAYGVLLTDEAGSQLYVPCFFVSHYLAWAAFFAFPQGCVEKKKMDDYLWVPKIYAKSVGNFNNFKQTYQLVTNEAQKEFLFQQFKKRIIPSPFILLNNLSTDFLSLLNENQLDETFDLLLHPSVLPSFINSECISLLVEATFPKFVSKFLDTLLEGNNFNLIQQSHALKAITSFFPLFFSHGKSNQLLAFILKNFSTVMTEIAMLHEVGEFFPELAWIFKQPTLKGARDAINYYNVVYLSLSGLIPKNASFLILATMIRFLSKDNEVAMLTSKEVDGLKEEMTKHKTLCLEEPNSLCVQESRERILLSCARLSAFNNFLAVIEHFKELEDKEALEQLFDFFICSENFNLYSSKLVEFFEEKKQVDRLFELTLSHSGPTMTAAFKAQRHKKIRFDLLLQPKYLEFVMQRYFGVYHVFFTGEESLGEEEEQRFLDLLFIPENAALMTENVDPLEDILPKIGEAQKERLAKALINSVDVIALFELRVNLLSHLFPSETHKLELFRQLKKPEHFLEEGLTLPVPRQLIKWGWSNAYLTWMNFFNFPEGSVEKEELFQFLLFPEVLQTLNGLEDFMAVHAYFYSKDRKAQLEEALLWKIKDTKGSMLCIDNDKYTSFLKELPWDEITDCIIQPALFRNMVVIEKNLSVVPYITKMDKFLDRLLDPDNFLRFFRQGNSQNLEKICTLCIKHNKSKELLRLIYANSAFIVNRLDVLKKLHQLFPENEIFSQPTLKMAYELMHLRGQAYKRGAAVGMFSFFPNVVPDVACKIATHLGVQEGRTMAATCKQAAMTARKELACTL